RIATTDDEDDDRASDDSVPPVLVPARADEVRLDERVDVGRERKVHDVRGQSGRDRALLVARCTVRLRELDPGSRCGLLKGRNQLRVGVLRRRVRDKREADAPRPTSSGGRKRKRKDESCAYPSHSIS